MVFFSKFYQLLYLLFFLCFTTQAQKQSEVEVHQLLSQIDSLKVEEAYQAAEKLEPDFTAYQDSSNRKIIEKKINLLFELDSLQKANSKMRAYLSLADVRQDSICRLWLQDMLSESYLNSNQLDSSLIYIDSAKTIANNLKLSKRIGMLLLREGTVLYAKGQYIESIESVFEATQYFEKSNEEMQRAFSYLQIGTTYLYIDFFEKAQSYYRKAGNTFLTVGDTLGFHICQANLGLVELEKENFSLALNYFQKAHPVIVASKRPLSIGTSYRYLGMSYQGLNQYDSASYFLEKALQNDLQYGYKIGICSDYLGLAELTFQKEEYSKARAFADSAKVYYPKHSDIELEADLYRVLAQVYRKLGKKDKSSDYFAHYTMLQDSLKQEEIAINAIAESESKKLEQLRNDLLIAKQKELIQEEENRIQQYFLLLLSIIAVVALFLLGLITSANKKNKQLNQALSERNKQVEKDLSVKQELITEIHHRVKNSLQVISSILSIQSAITKDKKLQRSLLETKSRISNLSSINAGLYRESEEDQKFLSKWIESMVKSLAKEYQVDDRLQLKLELENFLLAIDETIPAGILIHEMVSNIFKHAYHEEEAINIEISLYKSGKHIHLKLSDKGHGFPNNINPDESESLGLMLIHTMAQQLEGKLYIDDAKGVAYHLEWEQFENRLLS